MEAHSAEQSYLVAWSFRGAELRVRVFEKHVYLMRAIFSFLSISPRVPSMIFGIILSSTIYIVPVFFKTAFSMGALLGAITFLEKHTYENLCF